jgi:hypothetical protein
LHSRRLFRPLRQISRPKTIKKEKDISYEYTFLSLNIVKSV